MLWGGESSKLGALFGIPFKRRHKAAPRSKNGAIVLTSNVHNRFKPEMSDPAFLYADLHH